MSTVKKLQVVTGGTSGMGLGTAKALGTYGPVLIGGRNLGRLESAMEELNAAGIEAYGKNCDVSDRDSLAAFAEYAASIAPIGSVVNAAGVDYGAVPRDMLLKINMQGTHYVLETFLPYLDNSNVVNYSSVTGYFYQPKKEELELWMNPDAEGFLEKVSAMIPDPQDPRMTALGPDYMAYAASKRFVMFYTMANTRRVGLKNNSRIISVAPGSFMTPMLVSQGVENEAVAEGMKRGTAFHRLGEPDEIADLIQHLLAPGHEYLTGCDIIMDGGRTALGMYPQFE
ncbi:MAG: SDR family NAD(P)-dependent oxidoreductase [Oscillospiraceae bacterium]|nr:SDR family NAD(P)-dependent oxidoreductase [Oscillospiraceae bacterium]